MLNDCGFFLSQNRFGGGIVFLDGLLGFRKLVFWVVAELPREEFRVVIERRGWFSFLKSRVSCSGVWEAVGKAFESVQVKVLRLGFEVVGNENCVATTTTTTSLPNIDFAFLG